MATVADMCRFLDQFAPPELAEEWDNVGLLLGRADREVQRVMTCLTITAAPVAEAVAARADLIVAHHPLPFRPLKRITADSSVGDRLLQLIEAGIAVYSPHTAFDSARGGINQWLSEIIGIARTEPLLRRAESVDVGVGRAGELFQPMPLAEVGRRLKLALGVERIQVVGEPDRTVRSAAVGCGSAGDLLAPAMRRPCDVFVTGEATFHTCLEAQANHVAMILVGHYASERFAVERLAGVIAEHYPDLAVWASRDEQDPLTWL